MRYLQFLAVLGHLIGTGISVLQLPKSSAAEARPSVDLGYVRHIASYNSQFDYYNFTNIRYAQSPAGSRRLHPPIPPSGDYGTSDGADGHVCPQAYANPNLPESEDEDCLFLDVLVPRAVFDRNGSAPVLVWFYGGGFMTGYKTSGGDASGLLNRTRDFGDHDGAILLAMNYRLGAYGWLAGPTFQQNAPANIGLLDQRLALEWIQQYIHLFGGSPSRVTLVGESAGGASIMHHLTWRGNDTGRPSLFQRIVVQSPGFGPRPNATVSEAAYHRFLAGAGCADITCLRSLSPAAFSAANRAFQQASPYGTFALGPVVDGNLVPDLPGTMLAQGRFRKDVGIFTSRVAHEGSDFTPSSASNADIFTPWLRKAFGLRASTAVRYLTTSLYPNRYSNSITGYKTPFDRLADAIGDLLIDCNTLYLARAVGNKSAAAIFNLGRAQHGDDVGYTFYTEGEYNPSAGSPGGLVHAAAAQQWQRWIVGFAIDGQLPALNPTSDAISSSSPSLQAFPMYGANGQVVSLDVDDAKVVADPIDDQRCAWWQQGQLNGI